MPAQGNVYARALPGTRIFLGGVRMPSPSVFRLYGITCPSPNLREQVVAAIAGGVTIVQVRNKSCATRKLANIAKPIVEVCHRHNIPCIVDDDPQAAKLAGADGVHLGQKDMSVQEAKQILGDSAWIGVSAHTVPEAQKAQAEGATYLGCGAVFPTTTKADTTALPLQTLRQICASVTIPVVAIGGIQSQNALRLKGTGIDGIAVVSAIFGQEDCRIAANIMRQLADQIVEI